jgi:hypothetical protein
VTRDAGGQAHASRPRGRQRVGFRITRPSQDSKLLAMKLLAMRFGEDDEDIQILLGQAEIGTAAEALQLLVQMYPHREPALKTRLFLEEIRETSES